MLSQQSTFLQHNVIKARLMKELLLLGEKSHKFIRLDDMHTSWCDKRVEADINSDTRLMLSNVQRKVQGSLLHTKTDIAHIASFERTKTAICSNHLEGLCRGRMSVPIVLDKSDSLLSTVYNVSDGRNCSFSDLRETSSFGRNNVQCTVQLTDNATEQERVEPTYDCTSVNKYALPLWLNDVVFTSSIRSCLQHRIDGENVDAATYYAAGDNVDVTVNPTYMTTDNQRKSFHWFMTLAIKKRVLNNALPDGQAKCDIRKLPTHAWLPTKNDVMCYDNDIDFHILKTLVKYGFFKEFKYLIPDCISHPYIEFTKIPSEYEIVDLSDNNENTGDGMINIMTEVHRLLVPRDHNEHPNILETVDFGGDVLTNERAASAQAAMSNGNSSFENLRGLNHRPGGLHLLMNFTMVFIGKVVKNANFTFY